MMTHNHKKFDFRTAYIDLLINLLTGTVVLFILTTLLIAPITKNNEGIKKNADYVITMEWPESLDCDVDLWIRDPLNNLVSYKIPESGLMYYERDDKGQRDSVYIIEGQEKVIDPDNKEFVTFRGTFEGEYVVNVHVYSCINQVTRGGLKEGELVDIPVVVEVIKINPTFSVLKHINMKMTKVWEEQTAIRFVMNSQKNLVRYMTDFVPIRIEKEMAK